MIADTDLRSDFYVNFETSPSDFESYVIP